MPSPRYYYEKNNTEGKYPTAFRFDDTEIKKDNEAVATDLVDCYDTDIPTSINDKATLNYNSTTTLWEPGESSGGSGACKRIGDDLYVGENEQFKSLAECFYWLNVNCIFIPEEQTVTIHVTDNPYTPKGTERLQFPYGHRVHIDFGGGVLNAGRTIKTKKSPQKQVLKLKWEFMRYWRNAPLLYDKANNYLYLVFGEYIRYGNSNASAAIYKIDLNTLEYDTLLYAPGDVSRYKHGAVLYNGSIFVFGGEKGYQKYSINKIEEWNGSAWYSHNLVIDHNVILKDFSYNFMESTGEIYIVGIDKLYIINLNTMTISENTYNSTTIPEYRRYAFSHIYNGYLYYGSGYYKNDIWRLKLDDLTWENITENGATYLSNSSVFISEGKLAICGEYNIVLLDPVSLELETIDYNIPFNEGIKMRDNDEMIYLLFRDDQIINVKTTTTISENIHNNIEISGASVVGKIKNISEIQQDIIGASDVKYYYNDELIYTNKLFSPHGIDNPAYFSHPDGRLFIYGGDKLIIDDTIIEVPPLQRRYGASMWVHGDEVFIYGGRYTNGYPLTLLKYNMVTDTWSNTAQPTGSRINASVCYDQNRVIIAGGKDVNGQYAKKTWIYWFNNNSWEEGWSEVPYNSERPALFHAGSSLYMWGGSDTESELYQCQLNTVYDWKVVKKNTRSDVFRKEFGYIFDDNSNNLYIIGGTDENDKFQTDILKYGVYTEWDYDFKYECFDEVENQQGGMKDHRYPVLDKKQGHIVMVDKNSSAVFNHDKKYYRDGVFYDNLNYEDDGSKEYAAIHVKNNSKTWLE